MKDADVIKMVVRCPEGRKPRFRTRQISKGRIQRLAFCNSNVVEAKILKRKILPFKKMITK